MLALSRLPDTAQGLINELTRDLDPNTLTWLSGYLAGAAQVKQGEHGTPSLVAVPSPAVAAAAAPSRPATILFGSQTGNAERVATEFYEQCQQAGLNVRLVRADRFATRELKEEELLFIVISTQGEGDPPDDSIGFVEFLAGKRAPKLDKLQFGILGLGDSSYPLFCGIAETIEKRLLELGASKLLDSGLADLDMKPCPHLGNRGLLSSLSHYRRQPNLQQAPRRSPPCILKRKVTPATTPLKRPYLKPKPLPVRAAYAMCVTLSSHLKTANCTISQETHWGFGQYKTPALLTRFWQKPTSMPNNP